MTDADLTNCFNVLLLIEHGLDEPLAKRIAAQWQSKCEELAALRTQPEHLSGCLHPGNEPLSCQYEGQCLSVSCDHHGKTWLRPRMTLEAQDPNVLYPSKGE